MRSKPLLLPILMVLVVEINPGEAVESSPAEEAGPIKEISKEN